MTQTLFLEVFAGLCFQIALIVLVTVTISKSLGDAKTSCRLFTICFVSILMLTVSSLTLPHYRLAIFWHPDFESNLNDLIRYQNLMIQIGTIVYMLGVIAIFLRRVFAMVCLRRFFSLHCTEIYKEDDDALPILDTDRPSDLRILKSDKVSGPFCHQFHRPTIVLPSFLLEKHDDPTLRYILLHELSHLRTNHPMQLFLQQSCTLLFWFHPAVWWASRHAEIAREFLCDEVAARSDGRIVAYLQSLLAIIERTGRVGQSAFGEHPLRFGVLSFSGLSFGRRKSAIVERSEHLVRLAKHENHATPLKSAAALFALVLFAFVAHQFWPPVNALASSRSHWSPCPTWTARVLHDFGMNVRDFEVYDEKHDL